MKLKPLLIVLFVLFSIGFASAAKDELPLTKLDKSIQPHVTIQQSEKDKFIHGSGEVKTSKASALTSGKEKDGLYHIKDLGAKHGTYDLQIPFDVVEPYIKGGVVKVTHLNDAGLPDAVWIQEIRNDGGYAYFDDVPFSEIIIGGFIGSYEKTGTMNYQTSNVSSLGTTFDAGEVNYLGAYVYPEIEEDSPYDIPTDGLVGWWKFDENTGTNVYDSSGNGNNGTAIGGMTWTDGKYNTAGNFDGVDDYVTIPNNVGHIGLNDISIAFNVNFTDGGEGTILSKYTGWKISQLITNRISIFCYYGSSKLDASTKILTPGEYHNIIWVLDRDGYSDVWVDGILDSHTSISTYRYEDWNETVNTIMVGCRHVGTQFIKSDIDNVMVYNRTLSEAEIKQIYYDSIRDLKLRTNSNTGYSDEIDESGTVSIPYDSEDSDITSLTAYVPETVTIGGVTVRDYSKTVTPFTLNTTIGFTENSTQINEECDGAGLYTLNISYTPSSDSTTGHLNYTTTDADLLGADKYDLTLDSTDVSSTVTLNQTSGLFSIVTGELTADETYTYNITANWADTDFNATQVSGAAPFTSKFNDLSENIDSYAWDFENDGIIDSTKQNPAHVYGQAGNYTVNLTVTNEYGSFSTVKTDYITVSAPAFASDPSAWFYWVLRYLGSMFVGMWVAA